MRITELHVSGYRCFDELALENLDNIVCLVGPNGSGKSSILELIDRTVGCSQLEVETFMATAWAHPPDRRSLSMNLKLTRDDAAVHSPPSVLSRFDGEEFLVERLEYSRSRQTFPSGLRKAVVAFPSMRSFVLEYKARAVSDPQTEDWNFYRGYRGERTFPFQTRADALTARLAVLLRMQQSGLAKDVKNRQRKGEPLVRLEYEELTEVERVFHQFFEVTGKTFADPEIQSSGETAFYFNVPWSSKPLPISALSSGEQWLLLFFVEMEVNKWKNHIVLIDEIETHLHPELALRFVRWLENTRSDNQYWLTTHSPTLARYLDQRSIGFMVKQGEGDRTVEKVSATSLALLESLTGEGALIPISKTLVILEGSAPERERYSTDQTFFKELQTWGAIPSSIQFISVGTAASAEDYYLQLRSVEKELGVGWKIYAIRDRDAMPNSVRDGLQRSNAGRLWVWSRSSIEGYLLEPKVLRIYLKSENIQNIPSEEEIKKRILEILKGKKKDLKDRFERSLLFSKLPKRGDCTIEQFVKVAQYVEPMKNEIQAFGEDIDSWFQHDDLPHLLAFANCKELLKPLLGRYLHPDRAPETSIQLNKLVRDVVRAVMNERADTKLEPPRTVESLWPEIHGVIQRVISSIDFSGLTY